MIDAKSDAKRRKSRAFASKRVLEKVGLEMVLKRC